LSAPAVSNSQTIPGLPRAKKTGSSRINNLLLENQLAAYQTCHNSCCKHYQI
jgi:hypothetical protein